MYCQCYYPHAFIRVDEKAILLNQIWNLAEHGQVTNSAGFSIYDTKEDVVNRMGPMNHFEYLGTKWEGYPNLKFNITSDGMINAIISSDCELQGLTKEKIKEVLGKPTRETDTEQFGERLTYEVPGYNIDFLVPTERLSGTLPQPVVVLSHAY